MENQNIYEKPVTLKNILQFAVPTMAMTVFMSFYTMVDGLFVSNLIGTEALSAINLTAPVIQLVTAVSAMLATGGSAVYGPEAMAHMAQLGSRVYLKLSSEIIEGRIGNLSTRGVVIREGETIGELYQERAPLYERYADITVDAAGTPMEVVERIRQAVGR